MLQVDTITNCSARHTLQTTRSHVAWTQTSILWTEVQQNTRSQSNHLSRPTPHRPIHDLRAPAHRSLTTVSHHHLRDIQPSTRRATLSILNKRLSILVLEEIWHNHQTLPLHSSRARLIHPTIRRIRNKAKTCPNIKGRPNTTWPTGPSGDMDSLLTWRQDNTQVIQSVPSPKDHRRQTRNDQDSKYTPSSPSQVLSSTSALVAGTKRSRECTNVAGMDAKRHMVH